MPTSYRIIATNGCATKGGVSAFSGTLPRNVRVQQVGVKESGEHRGLRAVRVKKNPARIKPCHPKYTEISRQIAEYAQKLMCQDQIYF